MYKFNILAVILTLTLDYTCSQIPVNIQSRCVYKTKFYQEGESWLDGCESKCTCVSGVAQCQQLCLEWKLPSVCSLDPPAPGKCCQTPNCPPNIVIRYPPGYPLEDGIGTKTHGTSASTGDGGQQTGAETGTGNTLQTVIGMTPGCFYKNNVYQQDETWQIGCQYKCTCTNATKNEYECRDLCLKWRLPSVCTLDPPAAGKCCQTPNCPSYITINYPPGYAPETGSNTGGTGTSETVPSAGNTGMQPGCFYDNNIFQQDESWEIGCQYKCTCVNATANEFECRELCLKWHLPSVCTLDPPAPGKCCHTPNCPSHIVIKYPPGYGPETGSGTTGTGTVETASAAGNAGKGSIAETGGTRPEPKTVFESGNIGMITGMQPGCFYNNNVYQQDDTWQIGCEYKCTCVNATTNEYLCRDLCLKWRLPSVCTLDPPAAGKCCRTPNCPPDVVINYPPGYGPEAESGTTGTGTGRTQSTAGNGGKRKITESGSTGPKRETVLTGSTGIDSGMQPGCFHLNNVYQQDETWQVGCQYRCTCINAAANEYQCRDLCPKWNLPSVCTLDPPAEGKCCETPNCPPGVVINYPPGYTPETGSGTIGTQTDKTVPNVGSVGKESGTQNGGSGLKIVLETGNTGIQSGMQPGCYYKNHTYQQDESWKDGCMYKCTCTNAANNEFKCQELCLSWQLPSVCSLDPPAAGKCCKTPNCPSYVTINYPPGYTAE